METKPNEEKHRLTSEKMGERHPNYIGQTMDAHVAQNTEQWKILRKVAKEEEEEITH